MKVLFLCPRFFNYENEISDGLRRAGATVDYFDEKPFNNVFFKILLRLWKENNFLKRISDAYFDRILLQTSDDYDYVIVLKGESLNRKNLLKFKEKYKNATFIYYAWDSIKNYPHIQEYLNLFDRVFTFDDNDAREYDFMNHLPLFYSPDFVSTAKKNALPNVKPSIAFLGTVHSDRYKLLGAIYKKYKNEYDLRFVLYFPSVVVLAGFLASNIKDVIKFRLFSFTLRSRNKKQIAAFFSDADAVLDIQHPRQTGLTMRTIECLPLKRKFITTNSRVKDYDFYSAKNFYFINRENIYIDSAFFNVSFDDTYSDEISRYSVDSWISTLCSADISKDAV
ncbi:MULTISPECIES: hypothetical protein [Enterobacter cloacae complex]|uniref:hypothetical protein n=1 Tax=Enterobacter cloacae complex TaxID=354276 RepID=UPI000D0B6048|nr:MULTISPECIES: hypothetical protein [Enterobacter cloacae complex]AVP03222.1 hypothetical protein AM379_23705 [Enterobacter cloacae complex sp. FDA-CDC-AR_0132]MBQ0226035.1 hypothetical protein [Enterobacter ludwigii]QIN38919.1 hypothetical protein E5283_08050 [Enterobacter ludwigii]